MTIRRLLAVGVFAFGLAACSSSSPSADPSGSGNLAAFCEAGAPANAEAEVQAGHDILVGFRAELDEVGWKPADLSSEAATRFINLSQEFIEVSPAIRAACS